jgi:hypothetical protein
MTIHNPPYFHVFCIVYIISHSFDFPLCIISGVSHWCIPVSPCHLQFVLLYFPTRTVYAFLFSSCTCYIPCPFHPPWVNHHVSVWGGEQIMKLTLYRFLYSPVILSLLGQNVSSRCSLTSVLLVCVLPLMWVTKFQWCLFVSVFPVSQLSWLRPTDAENSSCDKRINQLIPEQTENLEYIRIWMKV